MSDARKICNHCGRDLPLSDFREFERRGKPARHAYCRICEMLRGRARDTSGRVFHCGKYKPGVKSKARAALNSAIRRGDVRPQPCEVCGAEKAHGHHGDYDKPLEVRWLCKPHHALVHRKPVDPEIIGLIRTRSGARGG